MRETRAWRCPIVVAVALALVMVATAVFAMMIQRHIESDETKRDEVDLETLRGEMVNLAAATFQPRTAGVWLPGEGRA